MSYSTIVTLPFERELKRLGKKHASLKADLSKLSIDLHNNLIQGKSLGNDCCKIRLAITSKGKSGGTRIITYVRLLNDVIYLLAIYEKSESETITDKEIAVRIGSL
ncbi:type II toxin-antitoxin system RelE/ParE family toxin [Mucilaginibacter sp.]